MDKERVKQELIEEHDHLYNGGLSSIIDVILDAVELARQDDQVLIGQTLQITTAALVVCPNCDGVGRFSGKGGSGLIVYCNVCEGTGMVKPVSNTPSA